VTALKKTCAQGKYISSNSILKRRKIMKNCSILKLGYILMFLTILMVINGTVFAQADHSEDVNKFLSMLGSKSIKTRIDALKYISRSHLSDPMLFNFIEKRLLEEYQLNTNNLDHIDEMAWLCKALASSGNEEYRKTLQKVTDTTSVQKLKKYAKQSMDLIKEYARKNKMLAENKYTKDGMSPKAAKHMTMLKSDEISMIKDAAKELCRSIIDDQRVYDAASEVLLEMYKQKSLSKENIDTLAWLCKALGASGMEKYKTVLDEIINDTSSEKLKKHATKSREMLQ